MRPNRLTGSCAGHGCHWRGRRRPACGHHARRARHPGDRVRMVLRSCRGPDAGHASCRWPVRYAHYGDSGHPGCHARYVRRPGCSGCCGRSVAGWRVRPRSHDFHRRSRGHGPGRHVAGHVRHCCAAACHGPVRQPCRYGWRPVLHCGRPVAGHCCRCRNFWVCVHCRWGGMLKSCECLRAREVRMSFGNHWSLNILLSPPAAGRSHGPLISMWGPQPGASMFDIYFSASYMRVYMNIGTGKYTTPPVQMFHILTWIFPEPC